MLITAKVLLGISLTDYTKDQILNAYCEIMQNKVKAYCYIDTIPAALQDVVAEMVAALYRNQYGSGDSTQMVTAQAGAIKKETVGDHTIEYVADSSSSSSGTSMPTRLANSLMASIKPRPEYAIKKPMAVPWAPQPKQW